MHRCHPISLIRSRATIKSFRYYLLSSVTHEIDSDFRFLLQHAWYRKSNIVHKHKLETRDSRGETHDDDSELNRQGFDSQPSTTVLRCLGQWRSVTCKLTTPVDSHVIWFLNPYKDRDEGDGKQRSRFEESKLRSIPGFVSTDYSVRR